MLRHFSLVQRVGIVLGLLITIGPVPFVVLDYATVLPSYAWGVVGSMIVVACMFPTVWSLHNENQQLRDRQDRQRASLQIVFRRQHPYWFAAWPGYRVGIQNNSHVAMAENVQVWLRAIEPDPNLRVKMFPSRLGHKDGGCGTVECKLNPQDEHFFDVVRGLHFLGSPQSMWALQTVAHIDEPLGLETRQDYRVLIRATAANADLAEESFLMRKNGDGTLCFDRWPDEPCGAGGCPHAPA